jgi:hypothetical protein
MIRLPLPDYKPDQSNNSGVLLKAENVYPAMDGYRPVQAIATISDALTGNFQGGASAISAGGTGYMLAGTATNLYKYNGGSWTSLIGSLSISGRWRFAQFGDYAVAVTGSTTYEVDLGGSTASAIAGAPSGVTVAVVGDYVVIGQPDGVVNAVQWSSFRDHTAWVDGVDQAGTQPIQSGGSVQFVAGGEYGIIFQREQIVRMTRTGDSSAPFQFDEVSTNFGCANGATVAQAGRTIFFRSDRGFMALEDGQELRPIGSEKVDRTFDAEVSRDDLQNIYTAVDPQNKLVMWGVPGSPGTLWIYNFELDKWSTAEMTFKGLFPGFTTSIGLDDLAVTYTNLDTMPYTLDDPRWSGGNPRMYLIDTDNKVGTLAGDTLAVQLDMGFAQFTPGYRARIRAVRPVTDATSGMTLVLDARARLGDAANQSTEATLRQSGVIPIRAAGRYISTSIRFAAGTNWDYIQGLEIDAQQAGER